MILRKTMLVALLALAGCNTHAALTSRAANTAATVMEIEYQMIMDNLAHMERSPATLPSHIRIKQGTVQVSDEWGLYQLEASGVWSGTFGGPRAERTVSEQWGADAISDPRTLKILQDLYRAALRLPPLPDPVFFAKSQAPQHGQKSTTGQKPSSKAGAEPAIDLAHDVPRGWFHVGTHDQVPADALYVSHSGPTWVWTLPTDTAGLSRFTLLVLFVTKLGPGESDNSGAGLMYTAGGK